MNIKKLLVLAMVLIFLFSITSCNKVNEQNTPKDTATPKSTEHETEEETDLSFLTPQSKDIVVWAGMGDVIVDAFSRDNPDYNVDYSNDLAGLFEADKSIDLQKLGGAIVSGEQPDLFEARMSPTEAYYSNLFTPIDKYIKNDPNYNIKDLDPNLLDATTFNGVVYFLPESYTSEMLVWNKDLFEKVGLDPEKPPATWSEFKDYCEKLVTYDTDGKLASVGAIPGSSLFNAFTWDQWHLAAHGQDAHYVDKTRLKYNWDTPEFLDTFEYIRELQNIYGGNDKIPGDSFTFFSGNTGFILWNGNSLLGLSQLTPFDFGFSTLPKFDESNDVNVGGHIGCSYGIPKDAKNPAGGWKFATYRLTDGYIEDAISYHSQNPTGFIPHYACHKPTREKLYETFEPLLDSRLIDMMKKRDEIEYSRNVAYYTSPVESKVMMYFNDDYGKFINFELSSKEFLKQLQSYSDTLIKEFKDEKTAEEWIFEDGKDGIPKE